MPLKKISPVNCEEVVLSIDQHVKVVATGVSLSGTEQTDKQMKDPPSENTFPSLTKSLMCSSTNASLSQFSQWQYITCRKIGTGVRGTLLKEKSHTVFYSSFSY